MVGTSAGIPLAYLLRPNAEPGSLPPLKTDRPYTARPDDPLEEGIAADLIDYASQNGRPAKQDRRFLYSKFDMALSGTVYQTTHQKHAKTQDGAAVFMEIASSANHAPQWEKRQEDNHQSKLDSHVPQENQSLALYFNVIEKAREELVLCHENGYGDAPTDKALVERALKCIKEVFPKDLDLHQATTTIKSDRELKHNFAKAKAVLLSKDPNPPPTKASPAGSQRGGRHQSGGRISALQESTSKKFPTPHKGRTGVILNVDYTGGKAFAHLTSEQYAECMARNAKGDLMSWKKVDSARDFIRNAKKTTAASSQRDKDAKVSAAVAEQTKSLRKERDRLADGVLSMSEELQSTQKRGRANHKSAKKNTATK